MCTVIRMNLKKLNQMNRNILKDDICDIMVQRGEFRLEDVYENEELMKELEIDLRYYFHPIFTNREKIWGELEGEILFRTADALASDGYHPDDVTELMYEETETRMMFLHTMLNRLEEGIDSGEKEAIC